MEEVISIARQAQSKNGLKLEVQELPGAPLGLSSVLELELAE